MARLLIKAVDAIHSDPATDKRGSYKRGDVVIVVADSHVWSPIEGPPTFYRAEVTDATAAELQWLVAGELEDGEDSIPASMAPLADTTLLMLATAERKTVRRRRYSTNINALKAHGGIVLLSQLAHSDKKRGAGNAI